MIVVYKSQLFDYRKIQQTTNNPKENKNKNKRKQKKKKKTSPKPLPQKQKHKKQKRRKRKGTYIYAFLLKGNYQQYILFKTMIRYNPRQKPNLKLYDLPENTKNTKQIFYLIKDQKC